MLAVFSDVMNPRMAVAALLSNADAMNELRQVHTQPVTSYLHQGARESVPGGWIFVRHGRRDCAGQLWHFGSGREDGRIRGRDCQVLRDEVKVL